MRSSGSVLFPTLAQALFVNPLAPRLFARLARRPGATGRFLYRSTGSRIDAEGVRCYERLFATSAHCAGATAMMANWDLAGLKRDLPRLRTPVLLIHGSADSAIPPGSARSAAALLADARLEPIPGLGHLLHEERPAIVSALIRDFADSTHQGARGMR
jgi:magnesium chelatase accessory protein